jgi:SAM-dependent methyltransferase
MRPHPADWIGSLDPWRSRAVDSTLLPFLPLRAWGAWRSRGASYAWHKALRRTLGRWPGWKRRLVYADPRAYWTLRGGDDYFREQEGQPARTARAEWLAGRIAAYRPASILEIGCGYGKQLRALRRHGDVPMVGLDFSPSQLALARRYLDGLGGIALVLGSGLELPFRDRSFDLVLTSAVILHNPPAAAARIRREVLRVARRYAAHNEDTDVSYNRYGYDTAAWYRAAEFPLAEAGPIPTDPEPSPSQFCVAELWHR